MWHSGCRNSRPYQDRVRSALMVSPPKCSIMPVRARGVLPIVKSWASCSKVCQRFLSRYLMPIPIIFIAAGRFFRPCGASKDENTKQASARTDCGGRVRPRYNLLIHHADFTRRAVKPRSNIITQARCSGRLEPFSAIFLEQLHHFTETCGLGNKRHGPKTSSKDLILFRR